MTNLIIYLNSKTICWGMFDADWRLLFPLSLKFVSHDATPQLPPGGPAGPRAVWETWRSLPGENNVARPRGCFQVSPIVVIYYLMRHLEGRFHRTKQRLELQSATGRIKKTEWDINIVMLKSRWFSLIACLKSVVCICVSGHWKTPATSGSTHISINDNFNYLTRSDIFSPLLHHALIVCLLL